MMKPLNMGPVEAGVRASAFAFIAFGALIVSMLILEPKAQAQDYGSLPDCLSSDTRPGADKGGPEWWSRRSQEEKKYLSQLPCEERYIAAVCIFLWDPNLKECVNKGVGDKRASDHCSEQGHEILSVEKAKCEKEYLASTYKPVF